MIVILLFVEQHHIVVSWINLTPDVANCFVVVFFYLLLVVGALIGKQEGRNIEVMNSFELLSHTVEERVHIDKEYYYTKEEQCELFVCVCGLYYRSR